MIINGHDDDHDHNHDHDDRGGDCDDDRDDDDDNDDDDDHHHHHHQDDHEHFGKTMGDCRTGRLERTEKGNCVDELYPLHTYTYSYTYTHLYHRCFSIYIIHIYTSREIYMKRITMFRIIRYMPDIP